MLLKQERDKSLILTIQVIFESDPATECFDENQISKFVTIMQGCENFCTYCVVPYTRGKERSRKPDSIIKEIKALAKANIKEVTLLGQNVNSYGIKEDQISFPKLLHKVSEIDGIERIRFATSHPKDLSDELINAIRDLDKVCNHLHLPVQSGSDRILKKMNRGYTRELYLDRINALKNECPDIALSTDIIVGFPSESIEDFNDTMELIKNVMFDSIFAFAYSDRSSAPAAKFSNQVEESVKKDRLNRLLALQESFTERKNKALIGETVNVLVEGKSNKMRDGFDPGLENAEQFSGRTESNKIVHFPSNRVRIGEIISIKITNAYPHSLWGHHLEY